MSPAEARQVACLLAIQLIDPLASPRYLALDAEESKLVDREIREIKTWLRLRSASVPAPAARRKRGGAK